MKIKTKNDRRVRIQLRQRKRISGTQERPRLSVFRSVSHIYAQVIDDLSGQTLVSASTVEPWRADRNQPGTEPIRSLRSRKPQRRMSSDVMMVTIDGQVGTQLVPGEKLVVRRADNPVHIVRLPGTSFFERMRGKLGWGDLPGRD